MPFFLFFLRSLLVVLAFAVVPVAHAAGDVVIQEVPLDDFSVRREALVESIENAGLVVSGTTHFATMLARTGPAFGELKSPYRQAEIVHFCSARLAWLMTGEDVANVVMCPLSIAIYVRADKPESVFMAYRSPGATTAGRQAAEALLRQLLAQAAGAGR